MGGDGMTPQDARGFRFDDGVAWIGERSFPDAIDCWESRRDVPRYKFRSRGFYLIVNGWTLSIQWGSGTYSENHDMFGNAPFVDEPHAVEVWGWGGDRSDTWPLGDEGPLGYQSVADVLALIEQAKSWPLPASGPVQETPEKERKK